MFLRRLADYVSKDRGLRASQLPLLKRAGFVRAFIPGNAEATKAASDGSLLVHWGLVTRIKPGWYSMTQLGFDFLAGSVEVQSCVLVREGKRVGFEGAWVDINSNFAINGKGHVRKKSR